MPDEVFRDKDAGFFIGAPFVFLAVLLYFSGYPSGIGHPFGSVRKDEHGGRDEGFPEFGFAIP